MLNRFASANLVETELSDLRALGFARPYHGTDLGQPAQNADMLETIR